MLEGFIFWIDPYPDFTMPNKLFMLVIDEDMYKVPLDSYEECTMDGGLMIDDASCKMFLI